MARISECMAAEAFIEKLESGKYHIECFKNSSTDYGIEECQDTIAVKEFTKSALFKQFKS